jgi:Tfp pilus assembly protein PilF
MKAKILYLLFAFTLMISEAKSDIEHIRTAYFEATESESKTKSLLKTLQEQPQNPTYQAYQAACEAILAKYAWNPYSKLAQVNKAKEMFRRAVAAMPDNPEIRFLRFSVQHNLPDFLRNETEFQDDKKRLLQSFQAQSVDGLSRFMAQQIATFVVSSRRYTAEEQAFFERFL